MSVMHIQMLQDQFQVWTWLSESAVLCLFLKMKWIKIGYLVCIYMYCNKSSTENPNLSTMFKKVYIEYSVLT